MCSELFHQFKLSPPGFSHKLFSDMNKIIRNIFQSLSRETNKAGDCSGRSCSNQEENLRDIQAEVAPIGRHHHNLTHLLQFPLFHPEILVFFQFPINTPELCTFHIFSCCILRWADSDILKRDCLEKCPEQLYWTFTFSHTNVRTLLHV